MGASMFDAGDEKPQGAESSALKNNAPFSLTPLRISEKASISYPRESPNDLQSLLESLQTNHLRVAVRATLPDAEAWSFSPTHCTILPWTGERSTHDVSSCYESKQSVVGKG